MYIKVKSWFLKRDIDPDKLKEYGFDDLYARDIDEYNYIRFYPETRRIVIRFMARESRACIVGRYIQDLIKDNLVEKKPIWEWWAIIGRWQNYSDEKLAKIEAELNKRNKELGYE